MMTILSGTLLITASEQEGETIKKGQLISSLGQFTVKYDQLNDLAEGEHEGFFEIAQIILCWCQHQGKYYCEQQALLTRAAFFSAKSEQKAAKRTEPPTTESPSPVIAELQNRSEPQLASMAVNEVMDARLFGPLFPLGESVQLDCTQSRERVEAQKKRLCELGYTFDVKTQTWSK